jgi:hypothetical protein
MWETETIANQTNNKEPQVPHRGHAIHGLLCHQTPIKQYVWTVRASIGSVLATGIMTITIMKQKPQAVW